MSALVESQFRLFSLCDCAGNLGCSLRQLCTDGEDPEKVTRGARSYRHTAAAGEVSLAYRTLVPAPPSAMESLDEAVARVVASAPRLSEAQLERLAIIIEGGGAA